MERVIFHSMSPEGKDCNILAMADDDDGGQRD
jgi:hypothetical protein